MRLALAGIAFVVVLVLLGFVFAGSSDRLAAGTRIAGVDVGGLSPHDARTLLERRAERVAEVPVTFTAAGRTWKLTPKRLGVVVDWAAAVRAAEDQGDGFAPVRGYKRIELRLFAGDVKPSVRVYDAALAYELGRVDAAVDRQPRSARLVRRGLGIELEPAQTGTALRRAAAARTIVRALAGFDRDTVALPVRTRRPAVVASGLRPALRTARRVVSAPVSLTLGETRWRLPRWRLALMLDLPERPELLALRGKAASDVLPASGADSLTSRT